MNKHLFAVAAAAALAAPAMAQTSSVTLYGIADAALVSTSNSAGSRRTAIDSGVLQSSRFGFRGTEDLGGGLSALFVLESGFNLDTGGKHLRCQLLQPSIVCRSRLQKRGNRDTGTPVQPHL